MFLMQMLHYSENYIEELSFKHKILFFTLPLLVFAYLYYLLAHENFQYQQVQVNGQVSLKNYKEHLNKKATKEELLDFLKAIEFFSTPLGVRIISSKIEQKKLTLNTKGSIEQLLKLMYFLETKSSFSHIKSFIIHEEQKPVYSLKIEVDFQKYWIKKLASLKLPFNNRTLKKSNNHKALETHFQLQAIVGNYVLINNVWCKRNDIISGYRVAKIGDERIELEKEQKRVFLKLRKDANGK